VVSEGLLQDFHRAGHPLVVAGLHSEVGVLHLAVAVDVKNKNI